MIRIFTDPVFRKSVQKLPTNIQKRLASLLERMQQNPFDPLLHTKRLTGILARFYSFRITRDYRVIFQFLDAQTIQLLDVGHRSDIYR